MAVDNLEVNEMTDKQSQRLGDLEQFYAVQKSIDNMDDPKSKEILEKQKKELIKRLDPN